MSARLRNVLRCNARQRWIIDRTGGVPVLFTPGSHAAVTSSVTSAADIGSRAHARSDGLSDTQTVRATESATPNADTNPCILAWPPRYHFLQCGTGPGTCVPARTPCSLHYHNSQLPFVPPNCSTHQATLPHTCAGIPIVFTLHHSTPRSISLPVSHYLFIDLNVKKIGEYRKNS